MKNLRNVLRLSVMFGMTGVGFASALVPVDATATYGLPSISPDSPAVPNWILLSSLEPDLGFAIIPGTTVLTFQGTGDLCYIACTPSSPEWSTTTIPNAFVAGFSTSAGSTAFLPTGLPSADTGPSVGGGWQNDFPNDFFINSTASVSVTVPDGALYAVFVVRDSHYADNLDVTHDLGIIVNADIPEPGTYGMLLSGISVLIALGRAIHG